MRGRLSYKGGSYENVTLLTLETMAGTIETACLNKRVLKPRHKLEKAEYLLQKIKMCYHFVDQEAENSGFWLKG